jgi:cytochrome c
LFILGVAVGPPAALADEPVPYTRGEALMQRYRCASCHSVYDPSKAPSLHAIARRYSMDPTAQQELETMVLNGSAGVWGTDSAMSANDVPAADLHTLVEWILSLR